MKSYALVKRLKSLAGVAAINAAVFLMLFAAIEVVLHFKFPDQNPLLGPPFVKSRVRVADQNYSHTLARNFDGEDWWGGKRYRVQTNSLGFKDRRVREVPLRADRKRVLFIGDSFTEGIGLPYEETFVGRFAAAFPQIDVLNAGVSSYAPSAYYAKIKYLLDIGLHVDEVVVYVDISDIQDEAIYYRFDDHGRLLWRSFDEQCPAPDRTVVLESPWWAKVSYVLDYLHKELFIRTAMANVLSMSTVDLMRNGLQYAADMARSSWTYDAKASCYGALGVEGAIAKALGEMDRLSSLLSKHGVELSVGVYPWPQQLLYDQENSRQVEIWRAWCEHKCRRFFDHFPLFFAYKREHEDFLRDLFIWPDVHFNSLGNDLFARDLISKYP